MNHPVTVLVITHNRRPELLRTLEKLRALPERPPVIVADNASRDGSADAVAARFPEMRLLRLSRNHGAVARNLAARLARTPYLAFCDDDSWWEPGSLSHAAGLLDAAPASPPSPRASSWSPAAPTIRSSPSCATRR